MGLSFLVVSVARHFGLGHFGLKTFRSYYEILQISYMLTLIQMYLNQQKVLYKKATSMIQDPTVIITNI